MAHRIRRRSRSPAQPRRKVVLTMKSNGSRSSSELRVDDELQKAKRIVIWLMLFGMLLTLANYVGTLLSVHPSIVLAILLFGSISLPIQTVLFLVAGYVYTHRPAAEEVFLRLIPSISASLGLAMMIGSKFTPYPIMRLMNNLAVAFGKIYHGILDTLVPWPVLAGIGIIYTIVCELMLIPAIGFLLFGVAQLKYAGEDFNANLNKPMTEKEHRHAKKIAVVFIHGNEFNECQWLFGRMYLMAKPFSRHFEFVSVNMFSGLMMRNHTEHTVTVKGCSLIALKQIQDEFARRQMRPDHVILMGHSLGGVVSSYLKEYLAKDAGIPVDLVVAWSAPLAGSALLKWAKAHLTFLDSHWNSGITVEFCPSAQTTAELRKRMEAIEKAHPGTYCAVSGWCDPLVRPSSGLLSFFREESRVLLPHLGHYNIKVSLQAWAAVSGFLQRFLEEQGIEQH